MVESLTQDQTLEWLSAVSNGLITEAECESLSIDKNEAKVLIGIYLNFITKKLGSFWEKIWANTNAWFKKRKIAYCKVSLIKPENDNIDALIPHLNFADCVNSCMSGRFQVKRLIFRVVRSISQRPGNTLTSVCDITMIYYNMVESVWRTLRLFLIPYTVSMERTSQVCPKVHCRHTSL